MSKDIDWAEYEKYLRVKIAELKKPMDTIAIIA